MKFKSSYSKRLFLYLLSVFLVFATVLTLMLYNREKEYRDRELRAILDSYTEFINSYIVHNQLSDNLAALDAKVVMLPRKDIRITVIALNGKVLYDSFFRNYQEMANHINRPEIQKAQQDFFTHSGSDIRISESTNQHFYYYAKQFDQYFVRAAVVYGMTIRDFLSVDSVFWYVIALVFLIISSIILYVSDTVGKSIVKLKDFSIRAAHNDISEEPLSFPENELGIISEQIVNLYKGMHFAKKQLEYEKERLINHIQISKEGIAIFSKHNEKLLANSIFIQYMNLIADSTSNDPIKILDLPEMKPIRDFIIVFANIADYKSPKVLPVKRLSLNKNMRHWEIQCIIFHDQSYEISINDVTQNIKQKQLKQQMTSNIAHELRTPVSSIKGYLETVLSGNDIAPEKQLYFMKKASLQTDRLSDLIKDIAMLTKIEETSELFQQGVIALHSLIEEVTENLQARINKVNAKFVIDVNKSTRVNGNYELIYSVFQNLIDNSLKYAGENITIFIHEQTTDLNKVDVIFADNGVGIDPEHHSRIFERFYRVEKGRNRESGGTGLGLAIVKHAIELHGNRIIVKSRPGGGVEFLFTLNKG